MLIMSILAHNKPIWQILRTKNQKFQNQKFVHCTFIIHKNVENTNI